MVDKVYSVISDQLDSLFQLNIEKWLIDLELYRPDLEC